MMQQQAQGPRRDNGRHSEIVLRQKRFALVLSGDDAVAEMLVERLSMMGGHSLDNSLSPSAMQYFAFKKLYDLWMSEAQASTRVAPLFQPGQEHQAIQKGLDPSIARLMGELPSLHRALLLLIYGENFSYAATAQLFNITIEQLMSALAAARQKFSEPDKAGLDMRGPQHVVPQKEVAHDATR